MAERTCLACGTTIDGATARRKYCDDKCKRRYHRGSRATNDPEPKKKPATDAGGIKSTEAATLVTLAEAGQLGTPGGQAALVLARRIDASDRDTGAGLASMVKQLEASIAQLTAGTSVPDDPLDELTRRREEKRRAAAG